MRIILDGMGGDHAPASVVEGAILAMKEMEHEIVIVGQQELIEAELKKHKYDRSRLSVADAREVITNDEAPVRAVRTKKDSSIVRGINMVKDGEGDIFISAGSTGALIMGSTFLVKRIKGISRAALAPLMPSDKGPFMLLDAGANADCRPEMLQQFAYMGSIYMTKVMGGGKPATVGLLNVGTEDCKGGELQHETFALLKDSTVNFIGNVEARDLPAGVADVVVADGFTGNVALKMMEGVADMLMKNIKGVFMTNLATKLAALVIKPHLGAFKKKMSTSEYGGAPLLGIAKPVIKAHGNSNAAAIKNAIRVAAEFAKAGVIEDIAAAVKTKEANAAAE